MIKIWFVIYNALLLPFLWIFFHLYGIFNTKVRKGISGRRQQIPSFTDNDKVILIHVSSLGEYQQAIPLMDEFLKLNYKIVLTFFSPSGFENSKISNPNIFKLYLPLDSYRKVRKFIDSINPKLLVLIRYDLWFNLLYYCKNKNIGIILANARFDENDKFWHFPVTSSFKKVLYGFIDKIFVIDDRDEFHYKKILKSTSAKIIKVGDSKFERVFEASQNVSKTGLLPDKVLKDKKVFVIGSSWKQDEEVILPAVDKILNYEKNLLIILVPHEPKETKIKMIESNVENKYENLKHIRYSRIEQYTNENFIIVDNIGKLMSLYSVSNISYVGGGFKSGLHNILEPAVFHVPVIFNNRNKNSDEDELMLKYNCGIVIEDTQGCYKTLRKLLTDENLRNQMGKNCDELFKKTLGTVKRILENLNNIK